MISYGKALPLPLQWNGTGKVGFCEQKRPVSESCVTSLDSYCRSFCKSRDSLVYNPD